MGMCTLHIREWRIMMDEKSVDVSKLLQEQQSKLLQQQPPPPQHTVICSQGPVGTAAVSFTTEDACTDIGPTFFC